MKKLSAFDLKIVAIIAMAIDHITALFLRASALASSPQSFNFILYQVLRGVGRLTMPLMVFCLVEGFVHTHNLYAYLIRLFVFAVISHFAFAYFTFGDFLFVPMKIIYFMTGIIAALFLSLLLLTVLFKSKLCILSKIIFSFLIFLLSLFCDWTFYPLMLAVIFYTLREKLILKVIVYVLSIPVWIFFNHYVSVIKNYIALNRFNFFKAFTENVTYFEKYYYFQFFMTGLFGVVPFIVLYNGKKANVKVQNASQIKQAAKKYFFYVFYPLHLIILVLIKNFF
jgi:hypothetical protein